MEVVPYKSVREQGVRDAIAECMTRHFEPRMAVMKASVVVVLGAVARDALGLPAASCQRRVLGGRERTVLTLAHPASFGSGKLPANVFGKTVCADVRRVLLQGRLPD